MQFYELALVLAPTLIPQDHAESVAYVALLSRLDLFAMTSLVVVLISVAYVVYQNRVNAWRWRRPQLVSLAIGVILATFAIKVRYLVFWHLAIHGAPLPEAIELLQTDGTWVFYTDPIYSICGFLNGLIGLGAPHVVLAVVIRRRICAIR